MATSPESLPENVLNFRAPPPSPIASGRRSSVRNDDILSEFLENSLRVPDLTLPDKIFPKQKSAQIPSKIDYESLSAMENDSISKVLDSVAEIGCFQLVNHGISRELIGSVSKDALDGIFRMSTEKKETVSTSPENWYGFEAFLGNEAETEVTEEFIWGRDEGLNFVMDGIWPLGYSNFSQKMEILTMHIEGMAEKLMSVLWGNYLKRWMNLNLNGWVKEEGPMASRCCLYKHRPNIPAEHWLKTLRHDVIRMLIRECGSSHALSLHFCDGSSEFHVYSKKGWLSFLPEEDAIVVTVGDKLQTWSGGQCKHVIGRPIFRSKSEDCISMAFLYSPSLPPKSPSTMTSFNKGEKTISLSQQAMAALFLTLIYHFVVYIYRNS